MKIQQHDGVVVEVAGSRQGFAKRKRGGRGVTGGRGRRQGLDCCCPPSPPTIYRAKGEGGRSLGPFSKEGCGQGGVHPPQGTSEVPSPLFGLSPLQVFLAHGPLGAGSLGPYRPRRTPHSPCGPPGLVDPLVDPRTPFGTPGTIPMTPKLVPMAETGLPIYKSLHPDHSGTPREVRISSVTPNNIRYAAYSYSYNPSVTEP